MSHLPNARLHGYQNRAAPLRINVETSTVPGDFSNIEFRINGIVVKEGLTASAGGNGALVDFTLTDEEMNVAAGNYRWECVATVDGEVHSIAQGRFFIGVEPTEEES